MLSRPIFVDANLRLPLDEVVQMPFIQQDRGIDIFCRPGLSVNTRSDSPNNHAGSFRCLKKITERVNGRSKGSE